MAFLSIENVIIKGVSACVPSCIQENIKLPVFLSQEDAHKFISSTGIENRRVSDEKTTTSDLCFHAAEKLIADLNWQKEDIDCLIFVTQTPDYILPATSCILQNRLGLSEECFSLDISLGCSGWVYGMSIISNLLSTGAFKKGLLLVGDTLSKINSKDDKSSYPLFADAGTATALEHQKNMTKIKKIYFHLATDGSGFETIIIPDGANRNRVSPESFINKEYGEGIVRNNLNIALNGMDVFSFGISKAPQSVNKMIEHFNLDKEAINYFIFHQANLFMNEKIRKKLKLPEEKVPYSLKEFGNTSSATIPLTMVTQLQRKLQNEKLKLIGCGFGVGLSWGSIYFSTDKIICSNLIEI